MSKYSRLESVEQKRNFRSALILIILSIAAVATLIVVGIPAVGKIASFVSDLRGDGSPTTLNDKTPPAPPTFGSFPDFTNQQAVNLVGTAEPEATVKLTFNGTEQEVVVDKDGNFSFQNLNLFDGDNTFSGITVDPAGNLSQRTVEKKIVYDNKPPSLSIDNPADGSKFFGSGQRQVTIQGTTDGGASITINERIVAVDESGKFQYTFTLNTGDNKLTFKSIDQSGNSTEKEITLNFSE
jgi:hypothetical protein